MNGYQELCRALAAELIKKDFNVVSGFGLGVGDPVIVGAIDSLRKNDDERLQLWPFPQAVPSGIDRAAFWRQYRERMLSNVGVCVVLAGNKLDGGAVLPANGVRQEVEIARSCGKLIIPIGATGHVARELWEQARTNPSDFYGSAAVDLPLATLGDENADVSAIVQAVIDIIRQVDR